RNQGGRQEGQQDVPGVQAPQGDEGEEQPRGARGEADVPVGVAFDDLDPFEVAARTIGSEPGFSTFTAKPEAFAPHAWLPAKGFAIDQAQAPNSRPVVVSV